MKRKYIVFISILVLVTIVLSACGGSDKKKSNSEKVPTKSVGGTVELQPLFYTIGEEGTEGGVSDITLELRETKKDAIRVAISDDEVRGSGPQWEAAAWNAMAVSTLITGASLDKRQFEVDATGFIDGPSAGALMTVGAISLIRGDKLDKDVTMTGTINPDGTIGPVGGIQYKLEGAEEAGKDIVLIPSGQNVEVDEDGDEVDLIERGKELGIKVKEVDSVYEAYKEFTGKNLPRLSSKEDPKLTSSQAKKLSGIVEDYSKEYESLMNSITSIPLGLEGLNGWIADADELYEEAKDLVDDEHAAAALSRIREAYGYAIATTEIIDYYNLETTSGSSIAEGIIQELDESFIDEFDELKEDLEDYDADNLGNAATLIDSYGTLTVAVSIEKIAIDEVRSGAPGSYDPVTAIFYIATAKAGVKIQQDVFDAFSNVDGPDISSSIDPETVGNFFRQGADANIAAFTTSIVSEIQQSARVSEQEALELLKSADPTVALVFNSQEIERVAEDVFGKIDNLPYAQLGAAVELYARSSQLIAGYYSLGIPSVVEGRVEINEFRSTKAFRSAKRLAKDQLSGVSKVLNDKDVDPIFVASAFELANEDDSTSRPQEAIRTLSVYWKGYVAGRVLTYLGGFPTAGLKN